jgi:hypothetical protein
VPLHDDGFLQTSVGFELAGDFVTQVVNTFMPQNEQWCERKPGSSVAKLPQQIVQEIRTGDDQIFQAIKSSNFYAELAKAAYPDLSIGTMAMFVTDPFPRNFRCQAVPLRELEISLGPDGTVDDRFAVRYTKNRYIKSLLGQHIYDQVPPDLREQIEGSPHKPTEVRWGYWRMWDELGDETWQHVVMIKNRVVHSAKLVGEGSCPLIVTRFNATADWAYALGPFLQNLPEMRQIDELEGQKIAHIELNLTPPYAFPDDSFAAIEQGLEPGMGYPVRVGSEDAIKPIYNPGSPETGVYLIDDKVKRLRKQFYVDYPEQRGDTPPTLGQWMDELARAQRRIGTPGLTFWEEGPAQYFLRFKYMLEKRGVVKPIKVNGNAVALHPVNPAQLAAEQQDVANFVRAIQILGPAFPEEFKALVDGGATMKAVVEKMRVSLLKFRDPKQVAAAVDQIQKLLSPRVAPNATPQALQAGGAQQQ